MTVTTRTAESVLARRPDVVVEAGARAQAERPASSFDNSVELTEREYEIVRLVATGLSNEQIAGTIFVGVNTIKSYIRSAYRKMGVQTRPQAVIWAFDHGLVLPALTETARALLSPLGARDAVA